MVASRALGYFGLHASEGGRHAQLWSCCTKKKTTRSSDVAVDGKACRAEMFSF